MATITKYVVCDREGQADGWEYDSFEDAKAAALTDGSAVVAREYEYADEELVWTPDGSTTWPPDEDSADEGRGDG
jgi:hypothetical protein